MPKRRKPQVLPKTSAQTSDPLIEQPHGGALRRGGKPGNKGGGRQPYAYTEWLGSLLDDATHRKEFEAAMHDRAEKHFMAATTHAANRKHGLPVQSVQVSGIVVHVSGGGIPMQRIDLLPTGGEE